jgi:hypothetical protein
MSTCEIHSLPELTVESYQLREVLRCVLHTVLFQRALGLVRPREVASDLFDVSYATCGDASAERLVEERIAKCCKAFESAVAKLARSGVGAASIGGGAQGQGATPVARFQVCMGFYQRRVKQVWFQKSEEKVYWEQWQLPLAIVRPGLQGELTNSAARAERQNALQHALVGCMERALELADAKKDHLPPVVSSDVVCFPFDITTPSAGDSSFGMDMLRKFVSQSPPSMLQ